MKSVRIRSYAGQYSVGMQENADHNNTKCGHFLHSEVYNTPTEMAQLKNFHQTFFEKTFPAEIRWLTLH